MSLVKFSHVDEFLKELEKDQDLIDRRVVRATNQFIASKLVGHSMQHVSVIATARLSTLWGGEKRTWIVRLEEYVGDRYDIPDNSASVKTMERAKAIHDKIEKWTSIRSFSLREGVYE